MRKYKAIVVLSKIITKNNQGSRKFDNGKNNFFYEILGDPYEFRFKAVKKLFSDGACSNFILVGGEVETIENGKRTKLIINNEETIPKAEVMRFSLINDYSIPARNLIVLKSASNTIGNAKETAKYFKAKNIKDLDKIGILTNFYDLPRTIKLFKEEASLSLIPICAESVIYDEEFDLIKNFYKKEGFSKIISDIKENFLEIKGMHDQEKGIYAPMFK